MSTSKRTAQREQLNVWISGLVHKVDPTLSGGRGTYCWAYANATQRRVCAPVTCVQCLALQLTGLHPWDARIALGSGIGTTWGPIEYIGNINHDTVDVV